VPVKPDVGALNLSRGRFPRRVSSMALNGEGYHTSMKVEA
jgi:hypothetical protein